MQVVCIDAPLKLQEVWVRELVSAFRSSAHEADNEARLRAGDVRALQQHVPPDLAQWDMQLPQQVGGIWRLPRH